MVFNIPELIKEFKTHIDGIIQIGAYSGDEANLYRSMSIVHGLFFEPQAGMYEVCKKNASGYIVEKLALGDYEGEVELNISYTEGGIANGSGASSSILTPKLHLTEHPQVQFPLKEIVQITTLDNYLAKKKKEGRYNFLSIDVQGFELNVLRGATNYLKNSPLNSGMIVEVNWAEMYEGCPMVGEIDEFLEQYGYVRKVTKVQSTSWGDSYYHRDFDEVKKCFKCGGKVGWLYRGDATSFKHLGVDCNE